MCQYSSCVFVDQERRAFVFQLHDVLALISPLLVVLLCLCACEMWYLRCACRGVLCVPALLGRDVPKNGFGWIGGVHKLPVKLVLLRREALFLVVHRCKVFPGRIVRCQICSRRERILSKPGAQPPLKFQILESTPNQVRTTLPYEMVNSTATKERKTGVLTKV